MGTKYAAVFFLGLLFFLLSACGNPSANPSTASKIVLPVDYGSGILYFDAYGAEFGKSLAAYRKKNPGTQIISIAPDDRENYGKTLGYWVIIKEQ